MFLIILAPDAAGPFLVFCFSSVESCDLLVCLTENGTGLVGLTDFFFRNASDNSWGARCSRRQGNFFPLTTHTGGVGCVLALGPEVARRPRLRCLETALDPVPFSMTIALLASSRGSCIPRPEMLLSLISVVLVLLVGELGVKLSSPSSLWT